MAVEYFHQHRERTIQTIDDVLRGPRTRSRGKAAEIDEHDGDAADIAGRASPFDHEPLDDLRRNVLAEQIGDAIACGCGLNAGLELPTQLHPPGPSHQPATQNAEATD